VGRFFAALLLCASVVLIAAAPSPTPTPAPLATPLLTPPTTPPPLPPGVAGSVLVYPFDVQTGADPKIGTAIAEILAQEMSSAGELVVMPVPVGIKRADFLTNAREQHADFYISGYVTPVGDAAAVVEQVVSVESGVILFSQTAQVQSVADVASQSLAARSQILAFLGRATSSMQQAPSSSTPEPKSTNGAQMQLKGISGIVDSVFHHRGATPTPAPVVRPARGVFVVAPAASAGITSVDLKNATDELYFALQRHYTAQMAPATANVSASADSICGANRNNTIASGTISQVVPKRGHPTATFVLSVYTCFGAKLADVTGTGQTPKEAVDQAVASYADAHPDNS
jgi:TolB-like protein